MRARAEATGRPERAPAPLALALVHPASRSHTTLRAQELLSRCEELLPPVAFAAAVARGRGAPLDTLVDELLALNLTPAALRSVPALRNGERAGGFRRERQTSASSVEPPNG